MPLLLNTATGRLEPPDFDYSDPLRRITEEIGERLAEARALRGVTQAQAASLIGVRQNTISNYENSRSPIDCNRLVALSLKLQLDPIAVMGISAGSDRDPSSPIDGRAFLHPTYEGYYWPRSAPLPESPAPYTFEVFGYSPGLSLAVVKAIPDREPKIDVSTDHLRIIVPGGADHAVLALEAELKEDSGYLSARGFGTGGGHAADMALNCPHPEDAFLG